MQPQTARSIKEDMADTLIEETSTTSHSLALVKNAPDKWSAGDLSMFICGVTVILICLPCILMNERKMARVQYVLDRGSRECLANVPINIAQK